jgi:hypothetical protein
MLGENLGGEENRKRFRLGVDPRPPRSSPEYRKGKHPFEKEIQMRFMVIVKASKDSEAGVMPSEKLLSDMGKYNEELAKAGVLLELSGLKPTSAGARVRFSGDKRTVIDGPFSETKELLAGFWILQTKSLEECIEWVKRCPNPHPDTTATEIEIRPFFELSDFEMSDATKASHERVGAGLNK